MVDAKHLLQIKIEPDYEALKANLLRKGTPARVHYMELFEDYEIKLAVNKLFGVWDSIDENDPYCHWKREIEMQRFLGYDCVAGGVAWSGFPRDTIPVEDANIVKDQKRQARNWTDEHRGPIGNWEDFEKYPWPDPKSIRTDGLEWLAKNLPDGMGIYAGCHSVFEQVTWLFGYETLCMSLYDQPDLVDAMFERIGSLLYEVAKVLVQMDKVDIIFGGDDMGFKTATMISAQALIEKSFPWHKKMAAIAHEHGKIYILHSCGNLDEVMEALIEDVKIDGRHSFEDEIEPVTQAKRKYGDRIALLGGIDVNFLCLANEPEIRQRVRDTLDVCMPGGGYCLGSGNSVTNYIPVENYLIMLDEGRKYGF
ncbi:uroporphyrinogen-III decarboxylase-like protein [Candidatus Poribacteria bacterium]|nr:uroporphyrinogen-III decarboxylase-like protein [Candidatus Poribacteria bacterium]